MSSDWKVPPAVQPRPQAYDFDLDRALSSVVGLTTSIPVDAFTADTLGRERAGHGVLIREDGIVLTIGYLITEASSVWLTTHDGRVVPGHVIGFDGETGFGLVQALGRLDVPAMPLGSSADLEPGDPVVIAGAGGRRRSVAAQVVMRQEFAGYWEYVLDDALFVAPSHPHWGGTAVIGESGELLGIGSLQLQQDEAQDRSQSINMVVPIDLLKPILPDMLRQGQADRPPRPWLGLFAAEIGGQVTIAGVVSGGPAEAAGLQVGDVVVGVADAQPRDLAAFFRSVWNAGPAGTEVMLRLLRDGRPVDVAVASADRMRLLKRPVLH
ncbi:S1C family serine protease [Enterovirga rhinocerotis]|uniref:S1-C subfamily serine protease n=1 Tax=Enterovirga rhinocerotis TaxID=1339210 RepID=A0A4R7C5I9_9HYPH|nr:S1C family serine protease [Enterovirga rhinocerotis]TDR93451.1 S1-C subfamily serine protease [Enterovirga rhinocerotis]